MKEEGETGLLIVQVPLRIKYRKEYPWQSTANAGSGEDDILEDPPGAKE